MSALREQFLDLQSEPWWLLDRQLDPALQERRASLGQCWGWTDLQWYAERDKLETLYLFLETSLPDLLRDLDDATDVDRRTRWLDVLIDRKQPPAGDDPQPVALPAALPAAPALPAPAQAGAAKDAPAKKVSPFARVQPAEPVQPEGAGPASPSAPAGTAEPAKKSIFKKKDPAPVEAAVPHEAAPAAEPTLASQPPEDLKEALAALADDPDVPISGEELEKALRDPDFVSELAAAEAELEAELAAAGPA